MILHYSRNPNPRLALTLARHTGAQVTFQFAEPFSPDQSEAYRALNPSRLIPILEEAGRPPLWEADAICCRLTMGGPLWPLDHRLPEVIRWISWGKANFAQATEGLNWEFGTKQRYGIGPIDWAEVDRAFGDFHRSAAQLEAHLQDRAFLLGDLTYADFRMACFLPYDDVIQLPLADYPALKAWAERMQALDFWADPFVGLDAPELPAVPGRLTYRRQSPSV